MMHVLFFSYYTGLGGGETSLLALLSALDQRQYTSSLVCPREGQLPDAARALGLDVYVLPYRGASTWFVPSLWRHFPAMSRIEMLLREVMPAVVHSDFHTLPFVLPACQRLGIPVVFTCWGWWFRPKPWQRDFYREGPQSILASSLAIKNGFLGQPAFMASDRVHVLYPGVDTERFRPQPDHRESIRREMGLSPEASLITLVGRFQQVKGHDVFLAAARLIAQRDPEVRFGVAGENIFGVSADEAFKQRVLSTAEGDAALRERTHFLGWVAQPERLIAASDIVVCSSRFESFGMAPVEAMASGVPVVSTNVGGTAETIVDGETGYLVPPARPDLIAERVLALLDDETLRERMGRAGRQWVLDNFSIGRYVAGFSETLDSLSSSGQMPGKTDEDVTRR